MEEETKEDEDEDEETKETERWGEAYATITTSAAPDMRDAGDGARQRACERISRRQLLQREESATDGVAVK